MAEKKKKPVTIRTSTLEEALRHAEMAVEAYIEGSARMTQQEKKHCEAVKNIMAKILRDRFGLSD